MFFEPIQPKLIRTIINKQLKEYGLPLSFPTLSKSIHHQGQSTITRNVAGSAKAILQGKDGDKQRGAHLVEPQHRNDKAERGQYGATGYTGCTNGKDAQQHDKEAQSANIGQRAVEYLRYYTDEEHLRKHRSAKMDIGKEGHGEVGYLLIQYRTFLDAL